MNLIDTTLPFLFVTIIALSHAAVMMKEHSLYGPYEVNAEGVMHWDLTGSAQLGKDFILLTPDEPDKRGAVWNSLPMYANNWELQTNFHIHGRGVHLHGDGLAIWYVRDSLHNGPVFGSKDYFSGLGIFIDTYQNQDEQQKHRFPYISAMVNNGSLHYEFDEDGMMTQIGGCHVPVRNPEVPTKIAISYMYDILAVYVDFEGSEEWKTCFTANGVHLPTGYYFGISASTSDVTDRHEIISATLLNLDNPDQEWKDKGDVIPEAKHVQVHRKYHKNFIGEEEEEEEEIQEIHERNEVHERKVVEDKQDVDELQEEILQKMEHKRETREAKTEEEKVERPTHDTKDEKVKPASISLLRKLIYITGSLIILLVGLKMFRKYNERRKERMQKRLY